MAKRKAWQRALSGLGEGMTNASQYLLRQQAQDRQNALVLGRQKLMDDQNYVESLLQDAVNGVPIEQIKAKAAARNVLIPEALLQRARPSVTQRIKPIGEAIDKATSLEMVPSDARLAAMGHEADAFLPTEFMVPDALTDVNDPFAAAAGELLGAREQAETKRRSLEDALTETVTGTDASGAPFTQRVSKNALKTPMVTGPNAVQRGQLAADEEVTKQTGILGNTGLTDLKANTEARLQNMVEGLTRQAKVTTAAATAKATKMAGLTPDVIQAEADRQAALNAGKDQSTEGERRAATNWAPLVKAHATAKELEDNGAAIGTGDLFMTKVPLANRMVPQQTKQYMQAARDFLSTLGLIRSGVTVRPDEAESLMATMFKTTGDDAQTLINKQHSREVFLAGMQAMVGRSGDDAGRILATAINNGQIPQTVLQSLQFDNEALKKSLLANLKGVPVFDIYGNPIGVK